MTATPSCLKVNKDLPGVIAVPGESVPHFMREGEAAKFEGWLLPTPLFNDALPGIRDALEHPPAAGDGDEADDGWEPNEGLGARGEGRDEE